MEKQLDKKIIFPRNYPALVKYEESKNFLQTMKRIIWEYNLVAKKNQKGVDFSRKTFVNPPN